jgi:hypothetical protein
MSKELRQRIYDSATGEVIRDEKFEPKKNKPHYHYYLTFYSALAKAGVDITSTMQAILGQMDYKNLIILNKDKLKILGNNYGKTPNALKCAINKMYNQGLLQRIDTALYFANPYYFSKTNVYKLEDLRKEYADLLFNARQTVNPAEKKRISTLTKQLADIRNNNPVNQANNILNSSKPFEGLL